MKRGITTTNAIIIAVIVIGSILAINLFNSLSGVGDISGAYTKSGNIYYSVKTGDIITSGDKTVTITNIGRTSIALDVNGVEEVITSGNTEIINGVSIKVLRLWSRFNVNYANLEIKILPNVIVSTVLDTQPFIETISISSSCVGIKTIGVEEIGATGSIVVDVSRIKEIISLGNTETVNGIDITNSEISGTKVVLGLKIPTGC